MSCAATHVCSLRTTQLPSNVQLACNGVYVALPSGRHEVSIWSLQDVACKPLELEGHHKSPTALCFGHRVHPTLLCSGASDYVIVWNIDKARQCLDTGQQIKGKVIGTALGSITHVAFSPDDSQLAACVDKMVYVLDATEEHVIAELEGHGSRVNCAEFCPYYTSTLVTAGDDRTFKVWDLSSNSLLYQSSIISSSPFLSISMNTQQNNFAIGTSDGQVRVYDLSEGNGFRCLHQLDVQKLQDRLITARHNAHSAGDGPHEKGTVTISTKPAWQQQQQQPRLPPPPSPLEAAADSQVGASVLALCYTMIEPARTPTPTHLSFLQRENTLVSELLHNAPMLVIATTGAIIQVNAKTLEPCSYVLLEEQMASNDLMKETEHVTLSMAGNMALAQNQLAYDTQQVWALVGSAFTKQVDVVSVAPPSEASQNHMAAYLQTPRPEEIEELSVLSSGPLAEKSPLKSEMVLKAKAPEKTGKKTSLGPAVKPGQLNKKGEIADKQPVVFRQKIQSSGYSKTEPKRQMFRPQTNGASKKSPSSSAKSSAESAPQKKEYPMKSDPPIHLATKIDVSDRPTSVISCKFSGDGSHVACGLGNTTAQVFSLPLTGKGCAFTGHRGVVNSVSWSCHDKLLVTGSEDKTACVWGLGLADPMLTFTNLNNNFGVDKEGGLKPSKDNPLFASAIKSAQFYYMDKFIILTSGNAFHLYKYHLDPSKSDIKRYLSNNRYKLVKSFQMKEAQGITAFSAINSFYSYLAFSAGSNKCVEVFDLNEGRSARTIPDVHTRCVHAITQNEGSAYVSHPPAAYDLFVTAAAGDCIKLWDLRSNRCVRRYEGHRDRSHPCGAALSPCARYLGTGAEDRSAYLYDLRAGTYLHKLTGHTDTVGQVAFHPLQPQLLTTTLDGKVRVFKTS